MDEVKAALLKRVNDEINGYEYKSDTKADKWLSLDQFRERGNGDCEDFAIAKYFRLEDEGIDPKRMRITYTSLPPLNGLTKIRPHMVLIVDGMVLDQYNPEIKSVAERTDLAPSSYEFNRKDLFVNNNKIGAADRIAKWKELMANMGNSYEFE